MNTFNMPTWACIILILLFCLDSDCLADIEPGAPEISGLYVVGSPFTSTTDAPPDAKTISEASIHENGDTSETPLPKPPAWILTHPTQLATPPPAEAKVLQKKVYSPDPCKNSCYLKLDTCQLNVSNAPVQDCNNAFMACLRSCFKRK